MSEGCVLLAMVCAGAGVVVGFAACMLACVLTKRDEPHAVVTPPNQDTETP